MGHLECQRWGRKEGSTNQKGSTNGRCFMGILLRDGLQLKQDLKSSGQADTASNFLGKGIDVLRSFKFLNRERITFSHLPFSVSIMGVLHMTKALAASLEIPVLPTHPANQEAIPVSRRFSHLFTSC